MYAGAQEDMGKFHADRPASDEYDRRRRSAELEELIARQGVFEPGDGKGSRTRPCCNDELLSMILPAACLGGVLSGEPRTAGELSLIHI